MTSWVAAADLLALAFVVVVVVVAAGICVSIFYSFDIFLLPNDGM